MSAVHAQLAADVGPKPLKHVFLVDGSGYIFRAYHALPPMTRPDGTPVNAVYGYTTMLIRLLEETDADHVAVIFDAERRNFRNEIYPEYKANRDAPPEDLIPQFSLIREATRAFSVACIEQEGYEADDIIATYARAAEKQGAEVTIVSSDKDLAQLITDRTYMWDPIKQRKLGKEYVLEKFGVAPNRVIDVQALAGDSIDNIPGVPGIGVKTAAQLIGEYGDLDTLLARAGEIRQPRRREVLIANAENARLSRQLVTLKDDVPNLPPFAAMVIQPRDYQKIGSFLKENAFKSLLARYQAKIDGAVDLAAVPAPSSPAAMPAVQVRLDLTPPTATRYELITTMAQLESWCAKIEEAGRVAVDTETDGLDAAACNLVGICLSAAPGEGCYIPLGHQNRLDSPVTQLAKKDVIAKLKPLLEHPGILKIAQNAKFDFGILAREGIRLSPIDDTMLMSYVLAAGARGHGMDELSELYLQHTPIKYTDVAGTGRNQRTFDELTPDEVKDYAAEDADITFRLHAVLRQELFNERLVRVYETIERPLIPVISDMEQAGVQVDTDVLNRLSADFESRLETLAKEIHALAGGPFNIGSPKQLGEILFDKLQLAKAKKTKTGAYQTGVDILEELAASGHTIAQKVLDWRQLAKLKSTYTDALRQQINPRTGRVHTSFSMAITTTGRLSSSDPNLQNIPIRTEEGRKIREAFVAPAGSKLISVDYSQIELRLIAHMADVKNLQQAFHDNLDIHAHTASLVFGVPMAGMDPMVRRNAKAINFGIIYGISPYGLARQLSIPAEEAKAFIAAYFQRFPEIRDFMESTKEKARKLGYVETLFGRRCHVPGIHDKNGARRAFAERAAINAPLQGTAADLIKRAMIRLPEALKKARFTAQMILQVHDELIFEAPDAEASAVRELVIDVMQKAGAPTLELKVPLVADGSIGQTWGEAH